MSGYWFSLTVALGSVLGALIATPNEENGSVIIFMLCNMIIFTWAFYLGRALLSFYRSSRLSR